MIKITEQERKEAEIRDLEEKLDYSKRLYRYGAGCFGIRSGEKVFLDEIQELEKKIKKLKN